MKRNTAIILVTLITLLALTCLTIFLQRLNNEVDRKPKQAIGISTSLNAKDSIYRLYFGQDDDYLIPTHTITGARMAGSNKIPITMFWGKYNTESPSRSNLPNTNGYYFDTVESGIIHKYIINRTTAWVNSASLVGISPSGDSIKLCGEGYFKTETNPLTVFIEDTIKVIIARNSCVNITAYKIPLSEISLTELAIVTLHKGEFKVINGGKVGIVKAPKNCASICTRSYTNLHHSLKTAGIDSWTRFQFDYKLIDINELAQRLGRRYGYHVHTLDNTLHSGQITANFDDSLTSILRQLQNFSEKAECLLVDDTIVITPKKTHPAK